MKKWKCKKSEVIIDTKFFKARKDIVELPTKELQEWTYCFTNDIVVILAITKERKIIMVRQYRYFAEDEAIEFPSGLVNDNETIEDGAKREFEEETGFKCNSLVKLGSFYEAFGQMKRKTHIFFARDLIKSKQNLDSGEDSFEDIEVELVDFNEAVNLALQNKIIVTDSALAILLLKEKIDKKEIIID
ncbi:hypothetical protein COY26_01430 [Candidatus Woesearchaeota archaeon CG_4_10_14_0_2_um_filter_33_10]|nr:MAG: hypothetical protein AUJ83_02475 [Candidatus Woesearchaeota archaeon CG1_02_33_12]PIN78486.1 MAG: hypothetical protein COV14_03600 [Candidatus Woesearchaeota archaeon CG10_big_fil_rev_8_21_14_0_10_33_12]PIU72795.1 MAG: hypothetical protein COS79_01090 [Candidatus Woesearchaeota archaeon CG06_land_8_20_14_3_00_33_13]PIZ53597.1 MAG: hypothetical protein COY26_01430 [Candidatus Woesearchaeota archaeon CG_4_10_14_0_2_um_filter_33_10]